MNLNLNRQASISLCLVQLIPSLFFIFLKYKGAMHHCKLGVSFLYYLPTVEDNNKSWTDWIQFDKLLELTQICWKGAALCGAAYI